MASSAQKNSSPDDPALREADELAAALKQTGGDDELVVVDPILQQQEAEAARAAQAAAEAVRAANEAAAATPVSERMNIRLLLVTTDVSLFAAGSQMQSEYLQLSAYFDELHIVVLTERGSGLPESVRMSDRMWVYATNSRSRLFALYDTYRIVKKQLSFAAGFRADIIAATDPFEAGAAAHILSRRFDRPLHVQVPVDPFDQYFTQAREGNGWRRWAARYIIPRAECVLVRSVYLRDTLVRRYKKIVDQIMVLPAYRDLSFFRDSEPTFDAHTRYPQFKFIILIIARLDARSKIEFAFDACIPLLQQYPTIGLVVVGDGPELSNLKKKVTAEHVQDHIIFEPDTEDLVSYMKTSNLLVNPANTEENDATLAAAAAAGLPVLTVSGGAADAIFVDGINGMVCPSGDMVCFQARLNQFLNDNQLRTTFSINGRNHVFEVVEQDAAAYRESYVQSFESCVWKNFKE